MLRALLVLVAIGLAAALYAILIERNWFAVRRHRVPCLPPGSRPLLVLHVSDLHLRAGQRRKQRFLRRLARFHPDLIVGTGDFLGDARSVRATVSAMTAIPVRRKAFFVLGSNDYYGPRPKNPLGYLWKQRRGREPDAWGEMIPNPWGEMAAALRAKGWVHLENETTAVDGIEVLGLDDAHAGRADLGAARARAAPGFRLAVAHSPDVAPSLAALGYDLIVCGHTHGGQVCLPGYGALVTNCDLPRSMASGLHRLDGAWLHVSAGLGTSMYAPYRLACRPEVCLLELVPREDARLPATARPATDRLSATTG